MPRHREGSAKYKLCKCGKTMNYYQDKCDHCQAESLKAGAVYQGIKKRLPQ